MPFFCSLGWHRWTATHVGESVHHYRECANCGKRTVDKVRDGGYEQIRQQWLDGGEWDVPAPATIHSAKPIDPEWDNNPPRRPHRYGRWKP
jgi:hypothetical protein